MADRTNFGVPNYSTGDPDMSGQEKEVEIVEKLESDDSAIARALCKALQGTREFVWPRQNVGQHAELIKSAMEEYAARDSVVAELVEVARDYHRSLWQDLHSSMSTEEFDRHPTVVRVRAALSKAGVK
jgi:hypothetical protein